MRQKFTYKCDPLHLCSKHSVTFRQYLSGFRTGQALGQNSAPLSLDPQVLETWLKALGASDPEKIERRLRWDLIPYATGESLLHEHSAGFNISGGDSWVGRLDGIREVLAGDAYRPLRSESCPDYQIPDGPYAFVDIWDPVADWELQNVYGHLSDATRLEVDKKALEDLRTFLLARLCQIAEQPLWEQFSLARGHGATLLAQLGIDGDGTGHPTRDIYRAFVFNQRSEGVGKLLETYPVLGRLLCTALELWNKSSKEMLERIAKDRNLLLKHFQIDKDAILTGAHPGLGDPHRGGRTVTLLEFTHSGDRMCVVYKPKDMRLDAAYQSTVKELNGEHGLSMLRTLTVLPRDGYGYMEYVDHRLCANDSELEQFYRNAGRITAVLHILGCTDCHHENFIADGDQLILIDAETLFEPEVPNHLTNAEEQSGPVSRLQTAVASSVLRSGLLPHWIFTGDSKTAIDISALGILPPDEPELNQPGWVGLNTDGMRIGYLRQRVDLPTSLPFDFGTANRLTEFLEPFSVGFQEQATWLAERRNEWLAPGGVLDRFRGLSRRILMRTTRVYYSIQQQQLAPVALKSAIEQGMKLEQLARGFLLAQERPKNWPVFEAELRQMELLDVPFFEHQVDSCDLPLPDGMASINGFMSRSGLESCCSRLKELDEPAINFQLQLIRGVVEAKQIRADGVADSTGKKLLQTSLEKLSVKQRQKESFRLGLELLRAAFRGDDGCPEWLGMTLDVDADKLSYRVLDASLYSGYCGISVFLYALSAVFRKTGDQKKAARFLRDSQMVLLPLVRLVDDAQPLLLDRWWRDQSLGLAGAGGVLLVLMLLDCLGTGPEEGDLSYRNVAEALLDKLPLELISTDTQLDLISGCCGLVGPLLCAGHSKALELAAVCGDQLIGRQDESGGWKIGGLGKRPLTGFSHGAAAVAAALAQLHTTTGEKRFLEAARRAVAYERGLFNAKARNWPDFRNSEKPGHFMNSWCHGAPGIALSRLCLKGTDLWDSVAENELISALETTSRISGDRDNICCGGFGRSTILRIASDQVKENAWQEKADLIDAESVVQSSHNGGQYRLSTMQGSLEIPGLFTGVSGIGLALLANNTSIFILSRIMSGGLLTKELLDTTKNAIDQDKLDWV